jgi:hypothetical protein
MIYHAGTQQSFITVQELYTDFPSYTIAKPSHAAETYADEIFDH